MVLWWVPYLIYTVIALAVVSTLPAGKNADAQAIGLSEFGVPQNSKNQPRRILLGTKWVTDPLIADYGDYGRLPIYS